ncbi:MAG TPA: YetF domain-containing protein [Cerasibacillus sp.]|uniref:DUF421 domain-containing protein n=1 Tax=Cerasibacillus sp. TaxID=2498711 RepID=UPI002F40110A
MDFFFSQESLTAIQWGLRAVVAFFFLLIIAKVMGQRSIAQLRLLDFMMALLLGNIISHPLSDEKLGLTGSLITMAVIVFLYSLGIFASLKYKPWRLFIDPQAIPVIKNGEINYHHLKKARISLDYLLAELRKEKVLDVSHVSLAFWEPGGRLSVFLNPQYQTVTPNDLKLTVEPFLHAIPIIKEGMIDFKALEQIGKDENWLLTKITYLYRLEDILLATVNQREEITVYLYN